jgi:iron complex outermembrane recepter protein
VERNTAYELRDRDREVWAGAPYASDPDAGNNRVWRRHYFNLDGPKDQIALGGNRDMRNMVETYNSAYLGDLTTSWTAANDRDAGDTVTTDSAMLVMQNYFIDRRLVTTLGYRKDDLDIRGPLVIRDPVNREWRFATPSDDPSVIAQYNSGRETWEVASMEKADFLTTGLVFHINDNFSLSANASEGAQLPERNRTVLPDDLVASPFDGQGIDYGISFSFLENRISGSLKYFESETLRESSGGSLAQDVFVNPNNDILQSFAYYFEQQEIADLSGANITPVQGHSVTSTSDLTTILTSGADAYIFDNASNGYEFELLANVTNNWIVRFNYSYTANKRTNVLNEGVPWWEERLALFNQLDSYYTSQTEDGSVFDKLLVDQDGTTGTNSVSSRVQDSDNELASNRAEQENGFGVRPHKANLWTRYNFSEGNLKGFTIGGGYRYQAGNMAGVNLDTGSKLYGNSTSLFDFMASYRTKGFLGFGDNQVSYQLNISNLFDADTLVATKIFRDTVTGEPFNKRVYRLDPRQVSLTVKMSF